MSICGEMDDSTGTGRCKRAVRWMRLTGAWGGPRVKKTERTETKMQLSESESVVQL